jgi:hypothetical protein
LSNRLEGGFHLTVVGSLELCRCVATFEVVLSLRHAIKVAYNRLTGLLPARAAGAFDTALDSFRTWSGPFNGQNARQQIIRDLVFRLRIVQLT